MEDCEDRKNFTMQYWQYYCILEEDCVSLKKFVDFREENMSTCSDEIIKQILSVCSEFDGLRSPRTQPQMKRGHYGKTPPIQED